ncbi:hypothetical protein MASR2M78_27400 [Treponema sp.]
MFLDPLQQDSLTEIVTMGIGKAGNVLNDLLGSHISLSAPSVRIVDQSGLSLSFDKQLGIKLSAVEMRYSGVMSGSVDLVFTSGDASRLVDCLIGEDVIHEEGLDALRSGTLCEIGNIVINALVGTLSNMLNLELSYTVPSYYEGDTGQLIARAQEIDAKVILLAETNFSVEDLHITGTIIIFFSLLSFDTLKAALGVYLAQ